MKSMLPLFVGVVLGMAWVIFWYMTPTFADDAAKYGLDSAGLCLGGPALIIMLLGMFITMLLEDRK